MKNKIVLIMMLMLSILLLSCASETSQARMLLNGESEITISAGDNFVDPGALAIEEDDFLDVVIRGQVNTSTPGSYILLYEATDSNGNLIYRTRTIIVIDDKGPEIILVGGDRITITLGDSYNEPGAQAVDAVDGGLGVSIEGSVDPTTIGTYELVYRAVDEAGNETSVTRTVIVIEPPAVEIPIGCSLDGTKACWNDQQEKFLFEPGATITIGVDNDLMGEALVDKWNADYPSLRGRLVYRNYGSVNGEQTGAQGILRQRNLAPDVVLVVSNEVVGREASLLPLHPYFANLISTDSLPAINDLINNRAPILLTAFWDGMSFSWNETMLRSLGVNVDRDSNGDGLPDAFDTWEKIFALDLVGRTYKGNTILEAFPVSLDEPWSGYSSVSSKGFVIFEQGPDKPGFDTPEFLGGLEFIQTFSQAGINTDETGAKKAASSMGWRWDAYLNDEAYPFALVGTWQNVIGAQQSTGSTFRFSTMPTFQGNPLRPFSQTKGIGINRFTNNPSAAHEVLRWLYTSSTMSSMVENSPYVPALQEGAFSTPIITDRIKREFSDGMSLNQLVPGATLPNNASKVAVDVYYNIGIPDFYKAVWDGTLTPAQAQAQIVSASAAWLSANNK